MVFKSFEAIPFMQHNTKINKVNNPLIHYFSMQQLIKKLEQDHYAMDLQHVETLTIFLQ
jgi:hypothetical protein